MLDGLWLTTVFLMGQPTWQEGALWQTLDVLSVDFAAMFTVAVLVTT